MTAAEQAVLSAELADPALAPGGVLTAERDRLVAATRRKYQEAFEDFALWCHDHRVAPLPASAETVGCYCSDLALRGLAVSTIQLRLAALRLAHRTAGHEPSVCHPSAHEPACVHARYIRLNLVRVGSHDGCRFRCC